MKSNQTTTTSPNSNCPEPQVDESGTRIRGIEALVAWFEGLVKARHTFSSKEDKLPPLKIPPLPPLIPEDELLGQFVQNEKLSLVEIAILAAAMAGEFDPWILASYYESNRDNPTIGIRDAYNSGQLLPSIQTMIFTLGGQDIETGLKVRACFTPESTLIRKNVIRLTPPPAGGTFTASTFHITPEYLHLFTTGQELKPAFSSEFPAHRIQTRLEWDDLVIHWKTRQQIRDIEIWLRHKDVFLQDWGMNRRFSSGYAALFHGPPGTGKTMAASLLGKATGRDVYRIDLSSVISKYIGETEKNLARIFDLAEHKEWILFFDEADSLFGKRGKVSDARDRYANQDVSFLLQRLEDFNGLSIMASNLISNIDEAFMRRFQSIIHFPMPNAGEREQLWQRALPQRIELENGLHLPEVAQKYELSGASIMHIVRLVSLRAIENGDAVLRKEDLTEGISREYRKRGKMV